MTRRYTAQERRTENRRQFFSELRQSLGGRCLVCASTHSLQFHHLPGFVKVGNVTSLGYRQARLESRKCILLCSVCHSIHHHPRSLNNAARTIHQSND